MGWDPSCGQQQSWFEQQSHPPETQQRNQKWNQHTRCSTKCCNETNGVADLVADEESKGKEGEGDDGGENVGGSAGGGSAGCGRSM